ncbi:MAG: hypothetical protein AAFO89_05375 [Planctomycetota bacterium]
MSDRARPSWAVHAAMWAVAITPMLIEVEGRGYPSGVVGVEGFFDGVWLLGWIALVLLGSFVAAVLGLRRWANGGRLLPRRRWIALAACAFVAGGAALRFDALFMLRFESSREALQSVPTADAFPATPTRIGSFDVLGIARDPRGGIYLKTGEAPDMIDTLSFGLAFEPNDEGSPFGNAYYRLVPLGEGWHRFEVSNDW